MELRLKDKNKDSHSHSPLQLWARTMTRWRRGPRMRFRPGVHNSEAGAGLFREVICGGTVKVSFWRTGARKVGCGSVTVWYHCRMQSLRLDESIMHCERCTVCS